MSASGHPPSNEEASTTELGDGSVEPSLPSEDELFDLLSNQRRRFAVHALSRQPEAEVELSTLAERVAAWENDVDHTELDYAERKRVYTALQQSHLPRMDQAGVVHFDKDRGVVEASSVLDDAEIFLEVVRGREIPWSKYYIGLSATAIALLGAVAVEAAPFDGVPTIGWFTAVVTAFTVSAFAHWYYDQQNRLGSKERPPELRE